VRTFSRTTQFKKDVKLAGKRGKDLPKLKAALERLIEGAPLPAEFKDHRAARKLCRQTAAFLQQIELSGFRPGVFIGYSPEGFLPKAATPFLQEAHHSSFTIHRLNPHYLFDPFSPGAGLSINLFV